MQLRPYQKEALACIHKEWELVQKTLLVLPTGCGKTIIFVKLAEQLVQEGKRVLILAHREELITQAADKLYKATGLRCAIEKADKTALNESHLITVGSVQTLMSRKRQEMFPEDFYDAIIVDECFTGDVEILTEKGFQRFDHLNKKLQIAQCDLEGNINFTDEIEYIEKDYSGELLNLKSDKLININCTPNHEVIVHNCQSGTKKVPATNIPINNRWKLFASGQSLMNSNALSDFERLLIALQADGTVHYNSRSLIDQFTIIHFQLKKERKIERLLKLCSKLDYDVKEISPNRDKRRFSIKVPEVVHKKVHELISLHISQQKAIEIIDEMVEWDGHKHSETSWYFSNVDKDAVDFYQAVCVLAGYKTNQVVQIDDRKPTYQNVYRLFILKNTNCFGTQRIKKTCYPYEGKVYCVRVPKSNIVVRKNGKTLLIGNCHHALSTSYQSIFKYFNEAKVLGVTATPDRGDKKNLGTFFESVAYEYHLPKAIRDGYLSPIKALTVPLKIELGKIDSIAGDFSSGQLDHALMPYLEAIADEMAKYCQGRKSLVFLPLISTSRKMTELLNDRGFRATEINGNSKDRHRILEDYSVNRYNVLCNSMLLTEGFDEPSVDCVVCLRPTKIRSLYCQIVGRGTRLSEGKEDLLLLDFLWNVDKHDLCKPSSLIAESSEVSRKMNEIIDSSGGIALDLQVVEEEAEKDVIEERENALARKLAEQKKKKKKLVDPLQYVFSIESEALINYEPAMLAESLPPSEAQLNLLDKYGIDFDSVQTKGYASKLISTLFLRKDCGLTTPKQIRFLEQHGFQKVGTWNFDDARKLIDRIATNRWRTPHGINPGTYQPQELF